MSKDKGFYKDAGSDSDLKYAQNRVCLPSGTVLDKNNKSEEDGQKQFASYNDAYLYYRFPIVKDDTSINTKLTNLYNKENNVVIITDFEKATKDDIVKEYNKLLKHRKTASKLLLQLALKTNMQTTDLNNIILIDKDF